MNTMKDRSLSKDSTIYNYRLLKRVYHNPIVLWVLWALPVCLFVLDLNLGFSVLPLLFSLAGVPIVHTLFIRLLYKMKEGKAPRGWLWSVNQPWVGLVPGSYISFSKMLRIHLQLFWMVLVILACFYPWISMTTLLHMAFVHLWLLVPRFAIFFAMRKFASEGYLKLNQKDTSCYAQ